MHIETPHSICRFGYAQIDVTPPVGIHHRAWGAARHDRATGVHRPLMAKVLAFQALHHDDEQTMVTLDHCLLGPQEMAALRMRAASLGGMAPQRLAILCTHTHGAGLMDLHRAELPGGELIPSYLHTLAEQLGAAIAEARTWRRRATLTYGFGRCDLARQRDFWDAQRQQYVCGYNPHGETDDTVLVVRVTGEEGEPLASIVNYACHPTTLAWGNTLLSPDFPGALCETVERDTGAPCVFLQGASGDNGPKEGFVDDPAVADRNGRQLGYAALAALTALPPPRTQFCYQGPVVSGATLGTWAHRPLSDAQAQRAAHWQWHSTTIALDYRPDLPRPAQVERELAECRAARERAHAAGNEADYQAAQALLERHTRLLARLKSLPPDEQYQLPVRWGRVGEAIWLCLPGEPYNRLQTVLRKRLGKVPLVIATLADDWLPGYLPTADSYGKGIYQASIALLAPGSLERLIEELTSRLTADQAITC